MQNLIPYLHNFAQHNHYGVSFLLAYGLTWAICGFLWRYTSEKIAAYATLFQGAVGLPLAFLGAYLLGALDYVNDPTITQLSIELAVVQALGLPVVIYFIKHDRRMVPYVFASIVGMHFFLYSWLYQTSIYIIVSVLIVFGCYFAMVFGEKMANKQGPVFVCFLTAVVLLSSGLYLLGK